MTIVIQVPEYNDSFSRDCSGEKGISDSLQLQ